MSVISPLHSHWETVIAIFLFQRNGKCCGKSFSPPPLVFPGRLSYRPIPMSSPWEQRLGLAQAEVRATLASLPADLRARAAALPVTFAPRPNAALLADGVDEDTLGLFIGEAFPDGESGAFQLPPQIMLFLETLWDFAGGDAEIYREEIRTTLLHELGHYLGLDEDEIEERGLE
jgi:predicted Zn-dependent protease with MMP-like domain